MIHVPIDVSIVPLRILIWPLLFGVGAYLLLTSQPIGRPRPDLSERLRRLDVDERVRMDLNRPAVRPLFHSRLLESMFRPLVDDAGRMVGTALGHLGFTGGHELERTLARARPGVGMTQFFGEKVFSAVIGGVMFPTMQSVGVHPFGPWPVWVWVGGAMVGFLAPDWRLEAYLARRRTRILMELPTLLDMLCLATSAGLALEQALTQVARESTGVVAQEFQQVSRELALGQRSLVDALEAMAERAGVPELWSLASHLRAAHEQGLPLVHTLAVQADTVREAKRLRIVEEGGKATVRMVLPVAVLILPVLFVVILYPAGIQLLHLGG